MNYVVANIIVLIFEILYYSMFMYYSKQEGKFWKYIMSFLITTIIVGFVGTKGLYSYIVFIVCVMTLLKKNANLKFLDIFTIIFMILLGVLIQLPLYLLGNILHLIILFTFIYEILKVILVYVFRKQLRKIYLDYVEKWNNNNFYIRYIATILMYLYIIITVILLINFS